MRVNIRECTGAADRLEVANGMANVPGKILGCVLAATFEFQSCSWHWT